MHILPRYPSYTSRNDPAFGTEAAIVRVCSESDIWVRPIKRVKCIARILATSCAATTKLVTLHTGELKYKEVTGGDVAAVDLLIGHGKLLNDFLYYTSEAKDAIIDYEDDETGCTQRTGYAKTSSRMTHIHIVTAHLKPEFQNKISVYRGDVIEFDLFIVNVLQYDGSIGNFHTRARGADRFMTRECPFVIPAQHLLRLVKNEENVGDEYQYQAVRYSKNL